MSSADMLILQNGSQVQNSMVFPQKNLSVSPMRISNDNSYNPIHGITTGRYSLEDITMISQHDISRKGSKVINAREP